MSDIEANLVGIIVGCSAGGLVVIALAVVTVIVCCRKSDEDITYNEVMAKYQQGVYDSPRQLSSPRGPYHDSQLPLWKRSVRRLKSAMPYGGSKVPNQPSTSAPLRNTSETNKHQDLTTRAFHQLLPGQSTESNMQPKSIPDHLWHTSSIPRPKVKKQSSTDGTSDKMAAQQISSIHQNPLSRKPEDIENEKHTYILKCYGKLRDTGKFEGKRPLYICQPKDYHYMIDFFQVIGKTKTGNYIVKPADGVPIKSKRITSLKKQAQPARHDLEAHLSTSGPLERRILRTPSSSGRANDRGIVRHSSMLKTGGSGYVHRMDSTAHHAEEKSANRAAFYFSGPDLTAAGLGGSPHLPSGSRRRESKAKVEDPKQTFVSVSYSADSKPSAHRTTSSTAHLNSSTEGVHIHPAAMVTTVHDPMQHGRFEQAAAALRIPSTQARKPPVEELKTKKTALPAAGARKGKKKGNKKSTGDTTSATGGRGGISTAIPVEPAQNIKGPNTSLPLGHSEPGEARAVSLAHSQRRDDTGNAAYSPDNPSIERERTGSVSTLKSVGRKVTDQFSFLDNYDSDDEKHANL